MDPGRISMTLLYARLGRETVCCTLRDWGHCLYYPIPEVLFKRRKKHTARMAWRVVWTRREMFRWLEFGIPHILYFQLPDTLTPHIWVFKNVCRFCWSITIPPLCLGFPLPSLTAFCNRLYLAVPSSKVPCVEVAKIFPVLRESVKLFIVPHLFITVCFVSTLR